MKLDTPPVFRLRARAFRDEPSIIVTAWEAPSFRATHATLTIEVRQGGRVVFERGDLYVVLPAHQNVDGREARACVFSCVAMRPGDTDSDQFASYTEEQLAFAEHNGKALRSWAERYLGPLSASHGTTMEEDTR